MFRPFKSNPTLNPNPNTSISYDDVRRGWTQHPNISILDNYRLRLDIFPPWPHNEFKKFNKIEVGPQ